MALKDGVVTPANAAVEFHGGCGYIDEYKVQKW